MLASGWVFELQVESADICFTMSSPAAKSLAASPSTMQSAVCGGCAGGQSVWKALRSGYGQAERSQAQRLKAVAADRGIKVPLRCFQLELSICASHTECSARLLLHGVASPPARQLRMHHIPEGPAKLPADEEVVYLLS